MEYLSNAAHGYKAHGTLRALLCDCLNKEYVAEVLQNYRVGYPGFGNDKQFYAPFVVQFHDRQRWAIFSTTSCRTDRVKGQQWDSENLKKLDAAIVRAYIVYPDNTSPADVQAFVAQREKYDSHAEYTFVDGICSFSELAEKIEEYSNEIFQGEDVGQEEWRIAEGTSPDDGGKDFDFKGRSFERALAHTLSDSTIFSKWKNGAPYSEQNRHYTYFAAIMHIFGLKAEEVERITASSSQEEIGLLPNGGQPKTDILVRVVFKDGWGKNYTISCKRSKQAMVSAHQYSADSFADVLDPNNMELRGMLHAFQAAGALSAAGLDSERFTEILRPYGRKLCEWVLSGVGGTGNPDTQFANYIVTYRPQDNRFAIHTVRDYIDEIMLKPRNFGTPFAWTFASGQRGKSIQLKMPVLL